jgi:hypothetical protein
MRYLTAINTIPATIQCRLLRIVCTTCSFVHVHVSWCCGNGHRCLSYIQLLVSLLMNLNMVLLISQCMICPDRYYSYYHNKCKCYTTLILTSNTNNDLDIKIGTLSKSVGTLLSRSTRHYICMCVDINIAIVHY